MILIVGRTKIAKCDSYCGTWRVFNLNYALRPALEVPVDQFRMSHFRSPGWYKLIKKAYKVSKNVLKVGPNIHYNIYLLHIQLKVNPNFHNNIYLLHTQTLS